MKKSLIVLFSISLVVNNCFAARIGGGRSVGMQRSIAPSTSRNYNNYNPTMTQPSAINQQSRQAGGIGAGTAAVLGAAAGAAGGYMLGKSMNNNASSTAAVSAAEKPSSSIPWGIIAILGILLVLGLVFFRKKASPRFSTNQMNQYSNDFSIPSIDRDTNNSVNSTSSRMGIFGRNQNNPQYNNELEDKMPDGVEIVYFLRQAKGMFLHIQSMNNPDNLDEIRKYMTPNLFEEIKQDISSNLYVADFPALDCDLVECDGTVEEGFSAAIRFSGTVSEEPQQPPKPFKEIWNFVKSAQTNNKWLIAGIQQEYSNNKG